MLADEGIAPEVEKHIAVGAGLHRQQFELARAAARASTTTCACSRIRM